MSEQPSSAPGRTAVAPAPPPEPRDRVDARLPFRLVVLSLVGTAVAAAVGAGTGYAAGRLTAPTALRSAAVAGPASADRRSSPPPGPGEPGPSGTLPGPSGTLPGPSGTLPGPSGTLPGPSESSLADLIGQTAGRALAGRAPQTVTSAQVVELGNQVPAGATIDHAANRITFAGPSASFTVLASPPTGPDMTFRIAGLTDPTLVVPHGAQVTVQFVNADPDQAHGWEVISAAPPYAFHPAGRPAIDGATAAVIGDPTAAGAGARTITFTAPASGAFSYVCPMPGHAQLGMRGAFVVT